MTQETKLSELIDQHRGCAEAYTDEGFREKLSVLPKSVIHQGLEKILLLREVLLSADCPLWARAVVLIGLGYLINPFDMVPDVIAGVGYLDDLAMVGLVVANVDTLITNEMRQRVTQRLGRFTLPKILEPMQGGCR